MSYKIYNFGGVLLPDKMTEDDLSPGTVPSTLVQSIDGTYDAWGSSVRLPRQSMIPFKGMYQGELTYLVDEAGNNIVDEADNYIITGTAQQILRSQIDNLLAMQGQRSTLIRQREDDGQTQYKVARLMSIKLVELVANKAALTAEMALMFESASPTWSEVVQSSVAVSLIAGGEIVLPFTTGPEPTDGTLTIAASGTIDTVTVRCPALGVSWTVATLTSGQSLVVNSGAQTVLLNGANDYSAFSLGSGHTAKGWLPMAPGNYEFYVHAKGAGGGTATLTWYNQWM